MSAPLLKGLKVALVHDWLTGMRGGEKCLEVLCELFPEADLYSLIHQKGELSQTIEAMPISTSFVQKLPFGLKNTVIICLFFLWLSSSLISVHTI
jgi:hypothetical protein